VVTEADLDLSDGRTLYIYDTREDDADARLAVFWHHGTPNTGAPPEPLFPAAARLGIRWVSYDRPGYGGSAPRPGRDIASAADDVAGIADAQGVGQFAVMTRSSSPRQIRPLLRARGPGWAPSPGRPSKVAGTGRWTTS